MNTANNKILTTQRLYLRQLCYDDQLALFEIYSDKEVMQFRGSAPFEDMDAVRKMIQYTLEQIALEREFRFGIVETDSDQLIGTFLYKVLEPATCEVGYSLGKNYWKMGYGFEVLTAMKRYLQEAGYATIVATTKKENSASIQLLTKAGFIQRKTERTDALNLFEWHVGADGDAE